MAVSFNTNPNYGPDLLKLFGVPDDFIAAAAENSVTFDSSTPGQLVVKGTEGSTLVPIKTQAITLAKANSLGPASYQQIKFQLMQALQKAMGEKCPAIPPAGAASTPLPKNHPTSTIKPVSKPNPLGGLKKAVAAPSDDFVATVKQTGSGVANLEAPAISTNTTVGKLADAQSVLQPVTGTSKGSVYFVVARLKGLNLAIRVKSTKLSIRAEGSKLGAYAGELADVGFDMGSNYASVHFDTGGDKSLVMKTVGAVIGRLGMGNLIQAADVSKLLGA